MFKYIPEKSANFNPNYEKEFIKKLSSLFLLYWHEDVYGTMLTKQAFPSDHQTKHYSKYLKNVSVIKFLFCMSMTGVSVTSHKKIEQHNTNCFTVTCHLSINLWMTTKIFSEIYQEIGTL